MNVPDYARMGAACVQNRFVVPEYACTGVACT
jgi:hypothetical protein